MEYDETTQVGGIYCIGEEGNVNLCHGGDFMAVTHVRAHGWLGSREDGICSRVIEMLTTIARKAFGLKWIWIDVALNSGDPRTKISSEQFNWIYTNAKCTLICDIALLGSRCGNTLQKGQALIQSEWNTRLWTMQEALLSEDLWVLQKEYCCWSVRQVLSDIRTECWRERCLNPDYYETLLYLSALVCYHKRSMSEMLACVVYAGKNRRAVKPIHLLKATFPLFDLEWPNESVSYEYAHTLLMAHLGTVGTRTISLFAPFGISGPYAWAPMTLIGTRGPILHEVKRTFVQDTNGTLQCPVASRWIAMNAKLNLSTPQYAPEKPAIRDLLPLFGHESTAQHVIIDLENNIAIRALAYISLNLPCPNLGASDNNLWLLRPCDSYEESHGLRHYVLGEVLRDRTTQDGEVLWKLCKLAVIECIANECNEWLGWSSLESEALVTWEGMMEWDGRNESAWRI